MMLMYNDKSYGASNVDNNDYSNGDKMIKCLY